MGPVQGRMADFLVKSDGSRIAGISLIENTLTRIQGIDQLQIIQESIKNICLNIVPGLKYNIGAKNELINYFTTLFGNIDVDVIECNEIPPEKSGKYRFSICKVNEND
jgi:phenylacetate-CoA ligase